MLKSKILFPLLFLTLLLTAGILTYTAVSTPKQLVGKAAGGTVDTLSFLLGKHSIGMSTDPKSLSGLTRIATNNYYYDVKSINGESYEYRPYDANYLYLRRDRSVNGSWLAPTYPELKDAVSYTVGAGIWLKRQMQIGESIKTNNEVKWYRQDCSLITTWQNWPYTMTLENETTMDFGGDIGKQDVIIVKFDYSNNPGDSSGIWLYGGTRCD